jgi:hypothetical protein
VRHGWPSVAALCTLAAAAAPAFSQQSQAAPGEDTKADLKTITVEAERNREEMQRQVKTFVSAIAAAPLQESLARWRTPVCPLVAGLARDHGEFILQRVTQIALAAGAPVAPEHCRGNFYVVVTADPDGLLKAWRKRNPDIFGDEAGPKVRRFLHASSPIRVWYNANMDAADGTALTADSPAMSASGLSTGSTGAFAGVPNNTHASGFRLARDEVRDLSSVIVMIDSRLAKGVNFGQLADYVAMAGLAEVRLDGDLGEAPSIFRLFSAPAKAPSLSAWDQAFLKAVYHTDPADKMQLAEIKTSVVREVVP